MSFYTRLSASFYKHLSAYLAAFAVIFCVLAPAALAFHPYSPFFHTTSQVIDSAGVLKKEWRIKLADIAEDADYFTGRTMIVLTVPTLNGMKPEYYAVTAGEQYGIGATSKPGVLLLLAQRERRVQITIGAGLENVLTPAIISSIMKERINPKLEKGDAGGALTDGATAVFEALQGRYMSHMQMLKQYMPLIVVVPLALVFFFFFGGANGPRINIFGGGAWGRW